MVSIEEITKIFELTVEEINQKDRHKKKIRKWINDYRGKIIGWNFGEQSLHMIFMKDGTAKLGKGEYPASETIIIGEPDTWIGVVTKGFDFARKAMEENKIWLRGNFHELLELNNVCLPIMAKNANKVLK